MKNRSELLSKMVLSITIGLILMGLNISSFAFESENIDIEVIKAEQENYSMYEDKPYSDEYLKYIALSDEEKAKIDVIPRKEFIAIHEPEENKKAYSVILGKIKNASSLPSRYDLRDHINISVENQERSGWCAAFASIKTLETYISKNKEQDYNFAEYHMSYMSYKYFGGWRNPIDESLENGEEAYKSGIGWNDFMKYVGVYSSDYKPLGPILGTNEENKMYEFNTDNKNNFNNKKPVIKVTEAQDFSNITKEYADDGTVTYKNGSTTLSKNQIEGFRNNIKKHIINNGAIYACTRFVDEYYNNTNYSVYINNNDIYCNHAIAIVGWDDNYSRYNFKEGNQPKNDGAYICLNSWGEDWGNNGYFYISYDDALVETWMSGIVSAKLVNESPNIFVSYSTNELTNEDVEVTVTCDERVEEEDGWQASYVNTKKDTYGTIHTTEMTLTKTFSSNTMQPINIKTVNGGITYPQMINIRNIDKAAPEAKINYSTTLPTKENVIVTITSNEELQPVDGWELSKDKKVLTKEYTDNIEEKVIIKDIVGNETEASVGIGNIDRTAPEMQIDYSTTLPTKDGVIVTIKSNEELQNVDGWKLLGQEKVLAKKYTDNVEEKIILKDIAGNETEASIKIENIDKVAPKVQTKYNTTLPTKENVIVTITSNEELQNLDGWTLSENKKILAKRFTDNAEEQVIVKDLAGNETEANIKIENIDKIAPKGQIKYSTTLPTKENVIVTIILNEEVQAVDGWKLAENKKVLTKEYTDNVEEKVIIKDLIGNETKANIKIGNIDKIAPKVQTKYNTTLPTKESVIVTITSDEELQDLDGWTLSENKKILAKSFTDNVEEQVIVKDLAGNETQASIKIENIDKVPPKVQINYNITEPTKEDVIVTITSDEELQDLDGWELSADKMILTKKYTKNTVETIIVKDLAGNEVEKEISIRNITDLKKDEEDNKTDNNEDNTQIETNKIKQSEMVDTTIANKSIPYTGYKVILNIIIPICIILLVVIIVKYIKNIMKKDK